MNGRSRLRIAIVLSGHLRSFRNTKDSYFNFKKHLEKLGSVDVFCHTWDIEESVTASWWKDNKTGVVPPATVNEEEIKNIYKPCALKIEPTILFEEKNFDLPSSIPAAGVLSMLHSQGQSFQLLQQYSEEKNVQYDIVIKSRYDLLYEIAPSFQDIVNDCITSNCLYLPISNPYEVIGSFSDVLAMGSQELMTRYFGFVKDFKSAVGDMANKGYREFLPELCLSLYLKGKKITIKELTALRLHILRVSGVKFQISTDKNFSNNEPQCFYLTTIANCKKMIPSSSVLITGYSNRLIKKYWQWIDKEGDEIILDRYVDFYNGRWIGAAAIKRMAALTKGNNIFILSVIKSYFGQAMRNAQYGALKKLQLAWLLSLYSSEKVYFFKVWKNLLFQKK